jgi:hypothetical protein
MLFALEGRGFEVLTFDLPRTTLIELAVYVWEIDNFVIKSDNFSGCFKFKNILNKIIVLP